MASRYSKVQTVIWNSDRFNKLTDFCKLLLIYLICCPHGNSAGLYRLKPGYAIVDLGCSETQYTESLCALRETGLIEYENDIIFVKKFLKYNPYTNPNHAKGSYREISEFTSKQLYSFWHHDMAMYCSSYKAYFPKPFDSLLKDYEKALTTDTDTDTITDTCTNTGTSNNTVANVQKQKREAIVGVPFTPAMENKIKEWCQYKTELQRGYKPTGLKAFRAKIQTKLLTHKEEDIISLIDEAMSNNYLGVVWKQLDTKSTDKKIQSQYKFGRNVNV